jgi:hypothetical protein
MRGFVIDIAEPWRTPFAWRILCVQAGSEAEFADLVIHANEAVERFEASLSTSIDVSSYTSRALLLRSAIDFEIRHIADPGFLRYSEMKLIGAIALGMPEAEAEANRVRNTKRQAYFQSRCADWAAVVAGPASDVEIRYRWSTLLAAQHPPELADQPPPKPRLRLVDQDFDPHDL